MLWFIFKMTRNKSKSPSHPLDYSNHNAPAAKNKKSFDVFVMPAIVNGKPVFKKGFSMKGPGTNKPSLKWIFKMIGYEAWRSQYMNDPVS